MVLGFERQFSGSIRAGDKRHTIRAERADGKRPQTGELLSGYIGLRRPAPEFIFRAPCLRTEDLALEKRNARWRIVVAGAALDVGEESTLARADGFRGGFAEMLEFWRAKHGLGTPRLPRFQGWITHWNFESAEFSEPRYWRCRSRECGQATDWSPSRAADYRAGALECWRCGDQLRPRTAPYRNTTELVAAERRAGLVGGAR